MKMRKLGLVLPVACLILGGWANTAAAAGERGGGMGFLVGCCLGVRTAAAWNEGKQLHWRDWGRLIPGVSLYVGVVDGLDGKAGIKTADLQRKFGAVYY
jgi:hypothetical protein